MTPRNLFKSALRAINALGAGATPDASAHEDAMEVFNLLVDNMSADELLPYSYVQARLPLSANKRSYTIGDRTTEFDRDGVCASQAVASAKDLSINGALAESGSVSFDVPRHVRIYGTGDSSSMTFTVTGTNIYGDTITEIITGPNDSTVYGVVQFKTVTQVASSAAATDNIEVGSDDVLDTRRPIKIVGGFVRDSSGNDTSLWPATRERLDYEADKDATTTTGSEIKMFHYDRSVPCGELTIHKVPSVGTFTAFLNLWQGLVQVTASNVDTEFESLGVPGELQLPLRWILAAELAPEYGKNVPDFVFMRAEKSLETFERLNTRQPKSTGSTPPLRGIDGQPAVNKT